MDNDISGEVIQQQMQETRASLTEKLETLEQKVVGTVENATSAVNETVDAIKETVHETVATVQDGVKGSVDSVKDLLDVPAHVDRHPWWMLGGSIAVGYCLGTFLTPSARPSMPAPAIPAGWTPAFSTGAAAQPRAEVVTPSSTSAEPSIWASEVDKLKGLALGVLFGTARELLASSLPTHLAGQVKEVVDRVTSKVGGQPLPSSDWAKLCEPTASHDEPSSKTPSQPEIETASAPGASPQPRTEHGNGHPAARRW